MQISKTKQDVVKAYENGFRIIQNIPYNKNGHSLKYTLDKRWKYRRITPRLDGKSSTILLHHLVAYQKFGDKWLYGNSQVRHLDNNSENNLESNIELGSAKENYNDKSKISKQKVITKLIITTRKRRKLSEIDINNIKFDYKSGKYTHKKLSEKYKVSETNIYNVINGRTYKNV